MISGRYRSSPSHDDISSRAGDGWDKQRAWKAVADGKMSVNMLVWEKIK